MHGGLDVAVAQQLLNRLEVVASQQQVTCKGVSEDMRRNPFGDAGTRCGLLDRALDMGLVKVIPPLFPELWNDREGGCREEPLPDELFGGVLVFLFELPGQKRASVAGGKVLSMQPAHEVHLLTDFPQRASRKWDRAVLLAFAVMDGEQHRVEVEALNTEVHALHQAQAAAVEQQSDQAVRRLQLTEDSLGLGMGEDDGDVAMAFGTNHPIQLAEFTAEDVSVEEQEALNAWFWVEAATCSRTARSERKPRTSWAPRPDVGRLRTKL